MPSPGGARTPRPGLAGRGRSIVPGFYHRPILDVVRIIRTMSQFEPVHLNVPNANYARIVRETSGSRRRAAATSQPRDSHQRKLDPRSRTSLVQRIGEAASTPPSSTGGFNARAASIRPGTTTIGADT